eukprot:7067221-Karenia_brevis.AAC.1
MSLFALGQCTHPWHQHHKCDSCKCPWRHVAQPQGQETMERLPIIYAVTTIAHWRNKFHDNKVECGLEIRKQYEPS